MRERDMTYEMSDRRFWDAREQQMNAEIAENRAFAATPLGRRAHIQNLENELAALQNLRIDSGIDNPARIAELEAEINAYHAEQREAMKAAQAAKDAEWSYDVTVERRAIWNALVATNKYAGKAGAVALYNRDAGFTFADLSDALRRHGIIK
jgi:hypothetical protein